MQRRIVGLSLGLMTFFAVATGVFHYLRTSTDLEALADQRLRYIAATAAAGLDGDAHAELNSCLDNQCPNYAKLTEYLRAVQT
ncbi:MAG: hypothetical protein HYY25_12020 [Candidatus Wallbacteria bacterium]|nr:hypothetical protein [Candidatus Wallbacteria bacterium]